MFIYIVHAEPTAVTIFRVAIRVNGQILIFYDRLKDFSFKLNDITFDNFTGHQNIDNFSGCYIVNKHYGACSKSYRSKNEILLFDCLSSLLLTSDV